MTPPSALLQALQSSRRPLLIAHVSPDGDAVGSLLGAGLMLYRLGKDPVLACQDKVPSGFQFLPFQDRVVRDAPGDVDLVVALDSSDPTRLGDVYDSRRHGQLPLIVIDHHVTNVYFGAINWVEPDACATAELIYYLAVSLDVSFDAELATCLLTGIVTDTRGFRTNNTSARVMAIASRLMEAGAPLNKITEDVLNTRSYNLIRLWARVLDTISLEDRVVSVANMMRMRGDLGGLVRAEGLASFILGAHEAQISAVFTELPEGQVECSFRARPGNDVSATALEYGGGGHPLAAGCTIWGPLDEVRTEIVARLQQD